MANLHAVIQKARDALLATPDSICTERLLLVTEAYEKFAGDPVPVKRAKALNHYLQYMTLDLDSNPVFAGNMSSRSRAWMLLPEYQILMDPQVALENPEVAHILDNVDAVENTNDFWSKVRYRKGPSSQGHLAVDMRRVVHDGLESILAEIQLRRKQGTAEQQDYREGMIVSLQAVMDWSARYALAAEMAANAAVDPFLRECYLRISSACRHVPAKPARDLFEGLQSMLLVHLATGIEGHGMSLSIGSPDRILAPFINDPFDTETATELIAAFMLKITANAYLGRGYLSQAITIGGADAAGNDCSNPLSLCFLKACDRLRVGDPPVFVRWHPSLNPELKTLALDMLARGVSMPLLVNDIPTVQGFIDIGVAPEDAWKYCVIGCNELAIPGVIAESAWGTSGTLLYVDLINQALEARALDMPALLKNLEELLYGAMRISRLAWQYARLELCRLVPTPFTSSLMQGCIERGQDLLIGMDHHVAGLFERGFTNAVNALAAIDSEFTRQDALISAVDGNFADEGMRARLRSAPKWGNDIETADKWALELLSCRERALARVDADFGQVPHMVCHVVRSLHHVNGALLPATLDGRRAGAPLADSIGAEVGTCDKGSTALLNSIAKINATRFYRGGYNLNLTLPPSGPDVISALIEVFFGSGGQELQVNVLSAATLRDARSHPECYGDLLVRVAGLSARFVDLANVEQDELILRAENAR